MVKTNRMNIVEGVLPNGTAKTNDCLNFITNNFELLAEKIALIYKKRWQIELPFKQLKQNFPLKYFLGDNENAIENWEKAVEQNPDLAIAFRNIGWGYYRHYENISEAISYYERAMELTQEEAIYYAELDALYELNNAPVDKRLKLFQDKNEVVKNRDNAFIRQIAVLTLAGQLNKAVQYLDGVKFAYREGSSRIRETIIDAQLMLGGNILLI